MKQGVSGHTALPRRWPSWALTLAMLGGWLLLGMVSCQGQGASPPKVVTTSTPSETFRLEAWASVEIRPQAPLDLGKVEPIPREVLATPGETLPLTALAYDSEGNPILDATFRWRMADSTAGAVTSGGIFQAGARLGTYPGAILVEARSPRLGPAGVARAEVSVTILPAGRTRTPVRVQTIPSQVEARPGQTLFLVAYPVDEAGIPVPGVPVEWLLLDTRAGTLTPDGKFRAGAQPGVYPQALQARAGRNLLSEAVTVRILDPATAPPLATGTVLPSIATLLPGEEVSFRAVVVGEDGQSIPLVSVRWETVNPRAGQVSATGRFRASYQVGNYPEAVRAVIRFRLGGQEHTATPTASVVVINPPQPLSPPDAATLARVVIVPQRLELYPNESATLVVMNLDGNGFPIRDLLVEWHLERAEAGSLTSYGKVTAGLTPGIYADAIRAVVKVPTPQGERVVEGRATLVVRGPLVRLTVTPSTVTLVPGQKVQFVAEGYDAFGTFLPGLRLLWRMADPRAGTITESGLFTAGSTTGSYPEAVRVEALQRYPP